MNVNLIWHSVIAMLSVLTQEEVMTVFVKKASLEMEELALVRSRLNHIQCRGL